jgi:hypothetical protein
VTLPARSSPWLEIAPGWMTSFPPVVPEFHEIRVRAGGRRVPRGQVRPGGEIRFFRLLTWIRSPRFSRSRRGHSGGAGGKASARGGASLGISLLAEDPTGDRLDGPLRRLPRIGHPGPRDFVALDRPGFCKAAMNFRLREEPGGWVRLSTETRVDALGSSARRLFAVYWRVIYPGSAFIRRQWLEAIRRRAEDPRRSCLEAIATLTRPVNRSLEEFEATRRDVPAAQRVLEEARLAREKLESAAAEPSCVRSKQEELVFLNHLILGFQAYIGNGSLDLKSLDSLESIIRRARVHQERGRAAI